MSSKIPPELTGKKGGQDSDYSDDNEAAPYNGFNNSISNRIKGLARTLSRSSSINSTGTNASLYSFFNALSKYANMVISKYLFRKKNQDLTFWNYWMGICDRVNFALCLVNLVLVVALFWNLFLLKPMVSIFLMTQKIILMVSLLRKSTNTIEVMLSTVRKLKSFFLT